MEMRKGISEAESRRRSRERGMFLRGVGAFKNGKARDASECPEVLEFRDAKNWEQGYDCQVKLERSRPAISALAKTVVSSFFKAEAR